MAKMRAIKAEESAVRAIQAPAFTDTWHPVSHALVLDAVNETLKERRVGVLDKRYDLSMNGANLFARYTLDATTGGRQYALGFRNSLEKRFAVGFAAGLHVIVCSNLMFNGEVVDFRKHTSGLDFAELCWIAARAFAEVCNRFEAAKKWHDELRQVPVLSAHRKILTYNAMVNGSVPPSKFHEFNQCYEMEREISEEGETLYVFHGAATRLMKDESLFRVQERNRGLEAVIEGYKRVIAERTAGAGIASA